MRGVDGKTKRLWIDMESGSEVKLKDGEMRPSGHEGSPRCDAVVEQLCCLSCLWSSRPMSLA